MTDSEMLDALEMEMKKDPLLLWDGHKFPGGPHRGLSLLNGRRTLRSAIHSMCGRHSEYENDAKLSPMQKVEETAE